MIERADIVKFVLHRMPEAVTNADDLDVVIIEVLKDLSTRENFLDATRTLRIEPGRGAILPEGFKSEIVVYVGDRKLEKLSVDDYARRVKSVIGTPTHYCIEASTRNSLFMVVWPPPAEPVDVNLDYYLVHPEDLNPIGFQDRYRMAVYEGVLARLALGRLAQDNRMAEIFTLHQQAYEAEIEKLRRNLRSQPGAVRYRDI